MKTDPIIRDAKRYGIYYCTSQDTLQQAARQMVAEDVSALVVQDSDGYLCGVITRTDLVRAHCADSADWASQPVTKWMSSEVITAALEDRLSSVACLLMENHIHRVVIVQPEGEHLRAVGVVSSADLVYHMVKELS